MTTVTNALSTITTQRPSALGLLILIGNDEDHALPDNPHALLEAAHQQLAVPASQGEIKTAIDALAHAVKWQSAEVVIDREPFMLAMYRALQRAAVCAPVLYEAIERLIASVIWMPGTAEVLASYREVMAEVQRGVIRARHAVNMLEASAQSLQKEIEAALIEAEDDTDPMADFRRYCAKRAVLRPIERQQRIAEARKRVQQLEYKLREIHKEPHSQHPKVTVVANRFTQQLDEARSALRAVEADAG